MRPFFAALLLLTAATAAAAKPELRWTPGSPGDGRPVLFRLSGLPEQARVRGRFLGQKLAFAWDPSGRVHVALAAVPLRTTARAHPVRVRARVRGRNVVVTARLRTARVRYPLAEVRIRPQPGAVKKGERAVDGREKIRAAVRRETADRYWSLPFHRPLTTRVTEAFGVRRLYMRMRGRKVVKRWRGRHMGLDLDGNGGEPIGALAAGVVAAAGNFFGTGKCVFLDHGQGLITAYYHMSEILVKEGERLQRGQVLGRVGATGRVSGPHLHLAARINGVRIDPAALLELGSGS